MQGVVFDKHRSLVLLNDGHVRWHVYGDHKLGGPVAYVRGYATVEGFFSEGEALAQRIHQIALRGAEELEADVPNLNGGWAFVVQWSTGEMLAAVDRVRTVPLFYFHDRDCFAVASSGKDLAHRFSRPIDHRSALEFLLFRYITGRESLYDGVRQIQPGETIHYQPEANTLNATRYYRFYPTITSTAGAGGLADELQNTIERMFERLREGFRGKRVVVPLSGGLDSRLVAGMLKYLGINDCECFTYSYGRDSKEEVEIAQQVADALGFSWRLVPYSADVWAELSRTGTLGEFIRYGCKGVSSPNVHDFPAVMQLMHEGLAGDQTVYFPAHSADMNAGSHIPSDYADILSGRISPVAHILRGHGRGLWDDPGPILNSPAAQGLLDAVAAMSAPPVGAAFKDSMACCDMWNAEQRQSKYIINSVRTYEFVGSQWRTLWDYEFMDFFLRVPVELRYGQRLYLECLRSRIFVDDLAELAAIPIAKHGPLKSLESTRPPARRETKINRWMDAVKRQTRRQLLKAGLARRHLTKGDPDQFIRQLLGGLGIPDGSISFEEVLHRLDALEYLAPDVQQALRPSLKFNWDSLRSAGVYGTIVLAEMVKDLQSKDAGHCKL